MTVIRELQDHPKTYDNKTARHDNDKIRNDKKQGRARQDKTKNETRNTTRQVITGCGAALVDSIAVP